MTVNEVDGMYDRGWLHEFALATRRVTLATGLVDNSCILSTRIGLEVLERHGVRAVAQAVRVAAYNTEGIRLFMQEVPHSEWPDSAWSVGIEGTGKVTPETKAWDGHLVLIVRNPNRTRTLIDLTADQLDRPHHNINVSGPVFIDLPPVGWTPHDPIYTTLGAEAGAPDATVIGYYPLMVGNWRSTPDWVRDPTERVDLVCALMDQAVV